MWYIFDVNSPFYNYDSREVEDVNYEDLTNEYYVQD